MSKFFVQILLSAMVAVSAAIGFSPTLHKEVHKTLGEAKSLAYEMTQAIFNTAPNVDKEVSAENKVASDVDSNLHFNPDRASKNSSETSIETSLSAKSKTEAEIKSNHVDLDLEHEIETGQDLDIGISK